MEGGVRRGEGGKGRGGTRRDEEGRGRRDEGKKDEGRGTREGDDTTRHAMREACCHIRYAGAPDSCVEILTKLQREARSRKASWYDLTTNYMQVKSGHSGIPHANGDPIR